MAWLLYVKARNVRQLLKTVREEHITNYRSRLKVSECHDTSKHAVLLLLVTWKQMDGCAAEP